MTKPRLIALLAWYNEEPADLQRAIASCAGIVDHLIALDGPYETFPHDSVCSPMEQWGAIERACADASITCDIRDHHDPWRNEGHKRTMLFQLAEQQGTIGRDWVIPIDADEELAGTEHLAAFLADPGTATRTSFWYHTQPHPGMTPEEHSITLAGTETRSYAQTRLLRLSRGMHVVQPTHWVFHDAAGPLTEPHHQFKPDEFHIRHHTMHRSLDRKQAKADHVQARNARGEQ
jgi:hypothetical protein